MDGSCKSLDAMVWFKPAFLDQDSVVSLLLHLVKSVLMIGVDTRESSSCLVLLCNLKPLQALFPRMEGGSVR